MLRRPRLKVSDEGVNLVPFVTDLAHCYIRDYGLITRMRASLVYCMLRGDCSVYGCFAAVQCFCVVQYGSTFPYSPLDVNVHSIV